MKIQVTAVQSTISPNLIYIDDETKQPYVNLAQLLRMFPNVPKTTLHRRLRLVPFSEQKTATIQTSNGSKLVTLYSSSVVSSLAFEFDLSLAKLIAEAGTKLYLYGLAGYSVEIKQLELTTPVRYQIKPWPELRAEIKQLFKTYNGLLLDRSKSTHTKPDYRSSNVCVMERYLNVSNQQVKSKLDYDTRKNKGGYCSFDLLSSEALHRLCLGYEIETDMLRNSTLTRPAISPFPSARLYRKSTARLVENNLPLTKESINLLENCLALTR